MPAASAPSCNALMLRSSATQSANPQEPLTVAPSDIRRTARGKGGRGSRGTGAPHHTVRSHSDKQDRTGGAVVPTLDGANEAIGRAVCVAGMGSSTPSQSLEVGAVTTHRAHRTPSNETGGERSRAVAAECAEQSARAGGSNGRSPAKRRVLTSVITLTATSVLLSIVAID